MFLLFFLFLVLTTETNNKICCPLDGAEVPQHLSNHFNNFCALCGKPQKVFYEFLSTKFIFYAKI